GTDVDIGGPVAAHNGHIHTVGADEGPADVLRTGYVSVGRSKRTVVSHKLPGPISAFVASPRQPRANRLSGCARLPQSPNRALLAPGVTAWVEAAAGQK